MVKTIQIFISYLVHEITLINRRDIVMNILKTKTLVLTLLSFCLIGAQGHVYAENNVAETNWILLEESPLLDRSSRYLSNGYIERGIRYAKKALARKQSDYGKLIIHHNLCIAYVTQGQMALATKHCAEAGNISIADTFLKEVRPGLYKISHKKVARAEMKMFNSVIAQNLQNKGLNNLLPRLAHAN